MTEKEVFDILRQIGCRTSAAAFIITKSDEGDDIRSVLPTLIEDSMEDFTRLLENYCAVEAPPNPQ